MKQLRTCGWQFYLERVVQTPSRPSVPAIAGVAVHTATEAMDRLLHIGVTDRTELVEAATNEAFASIAEATTEMSDAGWEVESWRKFGRATEAKPNGEDLQWFLEVGIPNCLTAYLDWRVANEHLRCAQVPSPRGNEPAIEVPFVYTTATGRSVRGYIDRVFDHPEHGPVVMDIKSGQKPKTDEQLGTYAAALRAGLGWDVTHGLYIYGLKYGTAKEVGPIDLTHWDDRTLALVYEGASQVIESEQFIPNPGEACWTCSVSSSCEFARAVI